MKLSDDDEHDDSDKCNCLKGMGGWCGGEQEKECWANRNQNLNRVLNKAVARNFHWTNNRRTMVEEWWRMVPQCQLWMLSLTPPPSLVEFAVHSAHAFLVARPIPRYLLVCTCDRPQNHRNHRDSDLFFQRRQGGVNRDECDDLYCCQPCWIGCPGKMTLSTLIQGRHSVLYRSWKGFNTWNSGYEMKTKGSFVLLRVSYFLLIWGSKIKSFRRFLLLLALFGLGLFFNIFPQVEKFMESWLK